MLASVCGLWPQCGQLETTQAATLKSGSSRTLLQFRPLASVWTVGDHPGHHTEVRIKQDFTSVPESSWPWKKLHQKFSYFSVGVGAGCTGLPAGLPIKENLGDPVVSQQPVMDTATPLHCHTPRGHNLNYTIWTLYAESVS